MNSSLQPIEACLFWPEENNEVVRGEISLDRHFLVFRAPATKLEIPLERLTLDLEKTSSRVYFHDDERPEVTLYTEDLSVLEHPAWSASPLRGQVSAILTQGELLRRLRLTVYVLAGCLLIGAGLSWGSGLAVRYLAGKVPPEAEKKFGDSAIKALEEKGQLLDDTNATALLAGVAAPLARVLPPGLNQLQFHISDSSIPNAFALPGGHIVVNRGLLDMVDEPEELLGVLAHEMAHVTQHHHFRKIISAAGPVIIFGVFLHSHDKILNSVTAGSGIIVFQGFSQEFETEADEVGWDYLLKANINPEGMISLFRKLKSYEDHEMKLVEIPQAFQSHPALEKRISHLESRWRKDSHNRTFLVLTNVVPRVNASEIKLKNP